MAVDLLVLGQQVLAAQPFSAFLGARLVAFDADGAVIAIDLKPEYRQQSGFAHGGILSYLADNTLTFAGGTVLGTDVLTGGFTIDYIRPALGEELIARATVVGSTSRQAICRCDIVAVANNAETLVATALGTIVRRGGSEPAVR